MPQSASVGPKWKLLSFNFLGVNITNYNNRSARHPGLKNKSTSTSLILALPTLQHKWSTFNNSKEAIQVCLTPHFSMNNGQSILPLSVRFRYHKVYIKKSSRAQQIQMLNDLFYVGKLSSGAQFLHDASYYSRYQHLDQTYCRI